MVVATDQTDLFESSVRDGRDPYDTYDRIVVAFSGGKDSLACVLDLLESGVAPENIELWHHNVDGAPDADHLMDWPVTEAYCRSVADALGIDLRFSWKQGGFEGEMNRENERTKPTVIETLDGDRVVTGGDAGKKSTRKMFPQVSANLQVRWCSAYLKIDIGDKIFTNIGAYDEGKFLYISGERAEESAARAKYDQFEIHTESYMDANTRDPRIVHKYRSVLNWNEQAVWDIIKRHGVNPHPAYKLGWGRLSCMTCIFGQEDQWASVKDLSEDRFEKIAEYERKFGHEIHRDGRTVEEYARDGDSFIPSEDDLEAVSEIRERALSDTYDADVFIGDDWTLPKGAFKDNSVGPS